MVRRRLHPGWSAIPLLALLTLLVTCRDDRSPLGPTRWPTPSGTVSATSPAVLVGAGDIAECDDVHDEETAGLLDGIEGTVFTVGDNAYENGSTADFTNCYDPTWGRHKARTRPVPGNHEYNTAGAAGYFNYFGAAAGDSGEGFYSYDLGDWHIIALNNYIAMTAGSEQDEWLQADLAATTKPCRLAYYHEPLYSSTTGSGSGGVTTAAVKPLFTTLYNGGVDVVLNGHHHFYERLAPMNPNGELDTRRGIREFVVGTGGASIGNPTNAFPLSEARFGNSNYGVLKLYLYSDSYAWKFVPVPGKVLSDTGSYACHGAVAAGVDRSLSTLVAAPSSFTAGSGTATITVTVKDAGGNPVSGATVELSATGSGNTLIQPTGPTDANGVATGTLASTVAETKSISAAANFSPLYQTAQVTATPGPLSAEQSSVTASPHAIAPGVGTSTITVTAKDANGNGISGATVLLAATGSGNTLTQPAGPTDANGVATGTLGSTVEETKTVSATANGTALTQSATVTVTSQPTATVTHTVLTAGNNLINQQIYTTAAIAPAPNTLVTVAVMGQRAYGASPTPTVSGGGMTAWVPVATVAFDPVGAPTRRLTVFRAMSAAPGNGPLTITFSGNQSNCQWIVSQWAGVETSGVNGSGAIVQTGSSQGDAVSGLTVPLAAFGNSEDVAYGVFGVRSGTLAVTPSAGFTEIGEQLSAESTPSDLEAEWGLNLNTIAATWTNLNGGALGVELKAAAAPSGVDAAQSLVTAAPTSITPEGAGSTISVTVKDAGGNPISGAAVELTATPTTGNTLTQPAGTTDANGEATGTLSSTKAELKTVLATATLGGVTTPLTAAATVTVEPGPVSATRSTVSAAPGSITAGSGSATITVTVKDDHDNPISGATVALAATGSGNTLTPPGPTDPNGVYTGTLSSAVAEDKVVSASATAGDETTALTATATVSVTGGSDVSATQSTVGVAPASITAGSGSATITVTVKRGDGSPISGATVALSASGTDNALVQPTGPTDANGEATGTLSSTKAEPKTVSATATVGGVTTPLAATVAVTVDPGPPSATASTLGAAPGSIMAGSGSATITVTVKDAHGNPISGATVALAASGSGNTLTQPAGPTDANGVTFGTLSSAVAETKTVSATADGIALTQTATVTVTPQVATIAHSLLTVGTNTANQRVYTTAAVAPAPNTLVTIAVLEHSSLGTPPVPALSGGGVTTWDVIATTTFDTVSLPQRRLTIFRAMSAAPGSGSITITSTMTLSHCQWIVSQWDGVDQSGTNGVGAIAQAGATSGDAVSGLSVPLAPFGNANNVAYGAFGVKRNVAVITPGAGFTEISEQPSGESTPGDLEAAWATNLTPIAAGWPLNLNAGALGVEIKARTVAP